MPPKVNNHYKDGTYSGVGEGYGGNIRVTVSVKNGQIIKVYIDSAADETAAYFNKAKTLTDRIIQQQTWKLDAVSGATYSSKGILEAVDDAMASSTQTAAPKRDPVRTFKDGTYTGSGTGYKNSRIRVQVTIQNGRITAIEILEADGWRSGECIRCNRCVEHCPKQNIRTEVSAWKGSEWWSLIMEAALVMGMILL